MITHFLPINIPRLVIYPGSWNPFHSGHELILTHATEILGIKPYLELSVLNADKGRLSYKEVLSRVSYLEHEALITDAPTFVHKAKYFSAPDRELIFVVGTDTWKRILDPKYAGPLDILKAHFVENNVKFLVFHRHSEPMIHDTILNDLIIQYVDSEMFDHRISSTDLRNKNF